MNVLPSGNVGSAGRRESMYVQNMWSSNWKTQRSGLHHHNQKRNHFTFSAAVAVIDRFHSHATKKNKLKTIQWKKLRNWDVIEDKKNKTLLQVLGLCVSPNFRYSSKCFAEIYRAQYENAIVVHQYGDRKIV